MKKVQIKLCLCVVFFFVDFLLSKFICVVNKYPWAHIFYEWCLLNNLCIEPITTFHSEFLWMEYRAGKYNKIQSIQIVWWNQFLTIYILLYKSICCIRIQSLQYISNREIDIQIVFLLFRCFFFSLLLSRFFLLINYLFAYVVHTKTHFEVNLKKKYVIHNEYIILLKFASGFYIYHISLLLVVNIILFVKCVAWNALLSTGILYFMTKKPMENSSNWTCSDRKAEINNKRYLYTTHTASHRH